MSDETIHNPNSPQWSDARLKNSVDAARRRIERGNGDDGPEVEQALIFLAGEYKATQRAGRTKGWTSEWPTEPGWWWVYDPSDPEYGFDCVMVEGGEGDAVTIGGWRQITMRKCWYGDILWLRAEPPAPPKDAP